MQEQNKEKTEKLEAFSHRLGVLAGRARLKQVQIAKTLGVTPQRVGSWFQGKNYPGPDIEHALADLLGTTTAWLIDGTENKENSAISRLTEEVHSGWADPAVLLERAARMAFEDVVREAAGRPERLGWLLEQVRQHLKPPDHWSPEHAAAVAKLADLKRQVALSKEGPAQSDEVLRRKA